MDARKVFWDAWSSLHQFDVIVSVPHGAKLPDGLEGAIKLTFGSNLKRPIENLKWHDDEGLQATLSFGGQPFECWLPLDSIAAITMDGWMVSWEMKPIQAQAKEENTASDRAAKAGIRLVK